MPRSDLGNQPPPPMTTLVVGVSLRFRREGLCRLLQHRNLRILATTCSPQELVQAVRDTRPCVALADGSKAPGPWLAAVCEVLRPSLGTVVFAMIEPYRIALLPRLLRAGARGFLTSHAERCCLLAGLRHLMAGDYYFSQCIVRQLVPMLLVADAKLESSGPEARLSAREKQVLDLLEKGHHVKSIAQVMGLHPKTVYAHQANILRKLEVPDVRGLLARSMGDSELKPSS
ncbi:MAG: response regulator transcription factor [Candidatus Riflebacteria bacterium]|nr:response regulator transcription factor [Candidatus Riflebacteria bacterium]